MRWDFAISCMEPIDHVTGGIGTYTRLLLSSLSRSAPDGFRIIAFLGSAPSEDIVKMLPNVRIEVVSSRHQFVDCDLNNAGDEHDIYGLHLAEIIADFTEKGHQFGVFEFPDYGAEAYYSIKLRRAGLIHIDALCVRLHSPEIMLAGDNLAPPHAITDARVTRFGREIYCYHHSDQIFFGGDAMLERVEKECRRYGVSITGRSTKIQHPQPPIPVINPPAANQITKIYNGLHLRNKNIGCIGRLETRKGFLKLVTAIAENRSLSDLVSSTPVYFNFFGADTCDFNERSNAESMRQAAKIAGLEAHFIFHGKLPQSALWARIGEMDGLIFPSIFENYANALLETLPYGIPTLISSRGALREISAWANFVSEYDPLSDRAPERIENFLRYLPPIDENSRKNCIDNFSLTENNMISSYLEICASAMKFSRNKYPAISRCGVSFIVPHFSNSTYLADCLKSIDGALSSGNDEVIVVDDGSPADECSRAREIAAQFGARFISMSQNRGPAAARNAGAAVSTKPYLQFLDADDCINLHGFKSCMNFIMENPEVDMVCGVAKCFGAQRHAWVPHDSHPKVIVKNFSHSAVLIRAEIYRAIGGQPEFLRYHYEDWGFNVRFVAGGYKSEMIPIVSLHYRIKNSSRSSTNNLKEQISRSELLKCFMLERPSTSAEIAPYLDCLSMIAGSSYNLPEYDLMSAKIARILIRLKYKILSFRHIPFIFLPIYWTARAFRIMFRRF